MTSGIYRTVATVFSDARIRSGLAWSLIAAVAGRSSALIISVILARMLGQDAFGEFSIIQSTIQTFGVFAGFGAGLTATKHIAESFRADPARSGRVLALILVMVCAFGALMTAVLIAGAPLIADRVLGSPHLSSFLTIASLGLFASALSGAQSGALAGFEEFQGLSKLNLYSGLITIVAVAVGVAFGGMTGALWGYNTAALISCCLGGRALSRASEENGVVPDYRNCAQEWPVLWRFSLPAMLANTLVVPASWICNALLVNQPNGFSEMAVYNVAAQWRQMLLFLPGIAAQVFLPIMSSQAKNDGSGDARANFQKVNMLIAAPFLIVLAVLSPLILALYGTSFRSQWPVFVVVQLATFAQIMQSPVITTWAAEGRMWTNLFANGFWGVSLVLLSWALIKLGALGLGLALLISFLIYFIVIRVIEHKEGNHGSSGR